MSILIRTFFFFVLFCGHLAYSAPKVQPSTLVESESTQHNTEQDVLPAVQEMHIAEPPPLKNNTVKKTNETFYPYQTAISPRLGMGSDSSRFSNLTFHHLFGFHFMLPDPNGRHWEVGTDVINDGTGVLSVGKKFVFKHNNPTRHYLKAAGAVRIVPSEQLNTLLKYEYFQIRGATGFEYFLDDPISARVDCEVFASTKYVGIQFVIGYSWAW
ncbi:MAG: hypothetical protein AB7F59_00595 [Bdellovibrionales bacterium]